MDIKINTTLKNKLFDFPEPIVTKKSVFWALHDRMFPCPNVFRDFLSTSDMSEKVEQAKYIIQRLCFESNFPPPYSLLMNLEEFENSDVNKTGNKYYVPQDHFCHLVYLYLLGLYLFFYVPVLNKGLTGEYLSNRQESQYDLAINATKDFISYWKYFCLYHDLTYPIEQIRGSKELKDRKLEEKINNEKNSDKKKNIEDNRKNNRAEWRKLSEKYLSLFGIIHSLIRRELFLEGGTKLLVIWQLITDPANKLEVNQFVDRIHNISTAWTIDDLTGKMPVKEFSSEDIKKDIGQYKIIDKLHNYEHMKMLSGFLEGKEYISILIDSDTELPVAIRKNTPDGTIYFYPKGMYTSDQQKQAQRLLDSEESLIDDQYYIRYFFSPEDLKTDGLMLKRSAKPFIDDDYKRLTEIITDNFEQQPESDIRFSMIATSADLSTYIFHFYRAFSSITNNLFDIKTPLTDSEGKDLPTAKLYEKGEKAKERIRKYLDDNFYDVFKETVTDQIVNEYKEFAEETKNSLKESLKTSQLSQYVNNVVEEALNNSKIDDYKKKIEESFNRIIAEALTQEKRDNGLLFDFIYSCRDSLFDGLISKDEDVWRGKGKSQSIISDQEAKQVFLEELVCLIQEDNIYESLEEDLQKRIKNVDKNFKDKNLPDIKTFISKYDTKYSTCDHGLFSSLIFLLSSRYYNELIEKMFTDCSHTTNSGDKDVRGIMSTLCWNVEKSKYENKLRNNYDEINKQIFKGIFYHNIYQSVVTSIGFPAWKYVFAEEPSNYFGMLTDTLQIWNRSKYYARDDLNWWPIVSSDFYNISIKDNQIILEIKNFDSKVSTIEKKYINDIEEYLSNFSAFVKIGRIEA